MSQIKVFWLKIRMKTILFALLAFLCLGVNYHLTESQNRANLAYQDFTKTYSVDIDTFLAENIRKVIGPLNNLKKLEIVEGTLDVNTMVNYRTNSGRPITSSDYLLTKLQTNKFLIGTFSEKQKVVKRWIEEVLRPIYLSNQADPIFVTEWIERKSVNWPIQYEGKFWTENTYLNTEPIQINEWTKIFGNIDVDLRIHGLERFSKDDQKYLMELSGIQAGNHIYSLNCGDQSVAISAKKSEVETVAKKIYGVNNFSIALIWLARILGSLSFIVFIKNLFLL